MPQKKTTAAAKTAKKGGKSKSTQASKFVKEEIDTIRSGGHGARNTKQAIAIGLSKARRAGVDAAPPKKGSASKATRKKAQNDIAAGKKRTPVNKKRSEAATKALKREGSAAVSKRALSKQGRAAAKKRSATDRSAAAKKAARTRAAGAKKASAKKGATKRKKA